MPGPVIYIMFMQIIAYARRNKPSTQETLLENLASTFLCNIKEQKKKTFQTCKPDLNTLVCCMLYSSKRESVS